MSSDQQSRRGQSLIGMLAVLVIGVLIFVFAYGKSKNTPPPTRPGGPSTTLGQALESGSEVDCKNNLSQIRLAINMRKTAEPEEGASPATLQELSRDGISPSMLQCSVTRQAYRYDPTTGSVACPTPGHDRY